MSEWWAQNQGAGQGQPCLISSPRPGLLTGRPLPALPAGFPLAFSCPPPSAGSLGRGKHFTEGLGLNGGQQHQGLRVLRDPKQGPCYLVNERRAEAPASGSSIFQWACGSIPQGNSSPNWGGAGPALPLSSKWSTSMVCLPFVPVYHWVMPATLQKWAVVPVLNRQASWGVTVEHSDVEAQGEKKWALGWNAVHIPSLCSPISYQGSYLY